MASRTVLVIECDDCGSTEATHYDVSALGHGVAVDLCDVHVKPLREVVERLVEIGEARTLLGTRRGKRKSPTNGTARTPRTASEATASGTLLCPECGRTDFKAPAGLGAHRFRAHGVKGTSSSATPDDKRAELAAV